MARYRFGDVFQENLDGSITPRIPVSINGIGMGPGVTFGGGVAFGGVDLQQYKGCDIEGEEQGGRIVIGGFHRPITTFGQGATGTISFSSQPW